MFLALGATRGRELNIPGRELDGVINGVDFLLNANLGYRVASANAWWSSGGGNVAIDVARTVLRYAAPEPRDRCRRRRAAAADVGLRQRVHRRGPHGAAPRGAARAARLARVARPRCRRTRTKCARPRRRASRCSGPRPQGDRRGENGRVDGARDARRGVDVRRATAASIPTFVAGQRAAPRGRHDHPRRRPAARHRLPGRRTPRSDHAARPGRGRAANAGHDDAGRVLRRRPGVRPADRDRGGGRRQARRAGHPRGARGGAVPRARAVPADAPRPVGRPLRPHRAADACRLPVPRRTGFREVEEGYGEAQARTEASRCLWCNVRDDLRLGSLHPLQRLRRDLPGGLPHARAGLAAGGRRRSSAWSARRWGPTRRRRHHQGRGALHPLRPVRGALPDGAITMEALEIDESPQTALGLFHESMSEVRR